MDTIIWTSAIVIGLVGMAISWWRLSKLPTDQEAVRRFIQGIALLIGAIVCLLLGALFSNLIYWKEVRVLPVGYSVIRTAGIVIGVLLAIRGVVLVLNPRRTS